MILMNEALIKAFELQGDTRNKEAKDIRIIVKYFNPTGPGTWYAAEYDPETRTFFGYANIGNPDFAELGYFSLDELENYIGLFGIGIEIDQHFKDRTLQEVIDSRGTF